jgi:outer membrane protein
MKNIQISKYILKVLLIGTIAQSVTAFGQNFPTLEKIAVIDYKKVSDQIGRSEVSKVNKYMADVSKANGIQIIHDGGVFVSKDVDITSQIIRGYKDGITAVQLDLSFIKTRPSIAVVNGEKVFMESKMGLNMQSILKGEFTQRQNELRSEAQTIKNEAIKLDNESSQISQDELSTRQRKLSEENRQLQIKQRKFTEQLNRRTTEERAKIAYEANPILAKLASKQGLSVIFQEVAYKNDEADITNEVISLLNQEKQIDQIAVKPIFSRPQKIALVRAEKVFSTFGDSPNMDKEERFKLRKSIAEKANVAISQIAKSNSLDIVLQDTIFDDPALDITTQVINSMQSTPQLNQEVLSERKASIEDFKQKCLDLGFKAGTEQFGKCVLRLSK